MTRLALPKPMTTKSETAQARQVLLGSCTEKGIISKIASAILRKALHMPAITAKKQHRDEGICSHTRKKGKSTKVIIAAIIRKLLHQIYRIIKHKIPFNPQTNLAE